MRGKSIIISGLITGLLFAAFTGSAAWDHNPQQEYHIGMVPTIDFLVLIFISFCTGALPGALIATILKIK